MPEDQFQTQMEGHLVRLIETTHQLQYLTSLQNNIRDTNNSQMLVKQDTFSSMSMDEYDIKEPAAKSNKILRLQTSNIDIRMHSIKEDSEICEDDRIGNNYLDIYTHSKANSLAIQMERRDSIRYIESLRKVHESKLKLQRNMLNKIAENMTNNRIELLKKMFKSEMMEFMKQLLENNNFV